MGIKPQLELEPAPERWTGRRRQDLLAQRGRRRRGGPERAKAKASGRGQTFAGERVLIVEDDVLTAWHLRSMVEDLKLEVCGVVGSADEAIEKAAEERPTLVLMDIRLGEGMDGIEAARSILRRQKVAVVFVTAYSDRRTVERIIDVTGEARIVPKPVNSERLRATIAAALSGNRN